jgi:hypothetical protein
MNGKELIKKILELGVDKEIRLANDSCRICVQESAIKEEHDYIVIKCL